LLEQIALKYQDIITKDYDRLARDCFNIQEHRLEMKTEAVIRSAYFRATEDMLNGLQNRRVLLRNHLILKDLNLKKQISPLYLGSFLMIFYNKS
jgi:PleD family two-component response regulator